LKKVIDNYSSVISNTNLKKTF